MNAIIISIIDHIVVRIIKSTLLILWDPTLQANGEINLQEIVKFDMWYFYHSLKGFKP